MSIAFCNTNTVIPELKSRMGDLESHFQMIKVNVRLGTVVWTRTIPVAVKQLKWNTSKSNPVLQV
jgi:hypothetical protein